MPINQLTVELGPKDGKITVSALIESLERVLDALRSLDDGNKGQWEIVRIRMASPLRVTVKNPEASPNIVPRYLKLIRPFEKHANVPKSGTEAALMQTRTLGETVRANAGYMKLSSFGEKSVRIDEKFTHNVEVATKSASKAHDEWTTLEGRLAQITVPEGGQPKFRIIDRLTGRGVECTFDTSLLEQVKKNLPSRVSVYGKARYNAIGEPKSISVETFKTLKGRSELPQLRDLADINITDGMDSAEFLLKGRNSG